MMSIERILELEKELYDARSSMNIGLYILFAGVVLVVINALGWSYDTKIMQGVVIGAGLVFSGVHYEKYQKAKKELNRICQIKYNKIYFESLADIIDDKYPKNK